MDVKKPKHKAKLSLLYKFAKSHVIEAKSTVTNPSDENPFVDDDSGSDDDEIFCDDSGPLATETRGEFMST